MKQVLFPKYAFVSGKTNQFSTDKTHESPIAIVHLDAPDTILATAPTKDFAIMYRHGKTQTPSVIEVDYNSLEIVNGVGLSYMPLGQQITCIAGEMGKTYTINFVKHSITRHERNIWRVSVTLKADCTAAELARKLVDEFTKIKKLGIDWASDIILTQANNTISFNQTTHKHDSHISIQVADALSSASLTRINVYRPATLAVEDIKNLLSEGIANKGAEYTYEEGTTVYPGVLDTLDPSHIFNVWTLRFAVPRKASKTRDEVVSQLVHIIRDTNVHDVDDFFEKILTGIKSTH